MGISANRIAIWLVALVGSAAAFGQSSPVLTGAEAYGDWRSDAPGVRRKITPSDMPPPYATASANNGPTIVEHPPNAWPKVRPRFVVELLATGLDNPRLIEVEVDESPEALDRAFDKVMDRPPGKSNQPSPGRSRSRQKRDGEHSP